MVPLQNQKADKTFVTWDEVVGKLRGTTHIESPQTWMRVTRPGQDSHLRMAIPLGLSGNGDDSGLLTTC